jgi:hypothetical protein
MRSDSIGAAYLRHYLRQQAGGNTDENVFRGARRWSQSGDGIGDILRGAARFALPVLFHGVKSFAGNALDAGDRGASFKDAVRSSIKPALAAAAEAVVANFQGGKRRAKTASVKRTKRSKKAKTQSGGRVQRKSKAKKSGKRQSQVGGKSHKRKTSKKRTHSANKSSLNF